MIITNKFGIAFCLSRRSKKLNQNIYGVSNSWFLAFSILVFKMRHGWWKLLRCWGSRQGRAGCLVVVWLHLSCYNCTMILVSRSVSNTSDQTSNKNPESMNHCNINKHHRTIITTIYVSNLVSNSKFLRQKPYYSQIIKYFSSNSMHTQSGLFVTYM